MLTSLPLFQTLCYSFSSWTVYIDIIKTNDECSSIISYVWWYIPTHIFLFPLVLMLRILLLLCLFIVRPHRYKHQTKEPPPLYSSPPSPRISRQYTPSSFFSRDTSCTHLLSSVRYDSIYIVDTETSTPARSKISPLHRALSNPLQLTGTMEVCLHCKIDWYQFEDTDMVSI